MPLLETSETTTSATEPSSGHRQSRTPWEFILVVAVYVALSARLLVLIFHYAVNVFFMDQWEFNEATLFQKHTLWEMFRWQHGPHRQGLGAIVTYLLDPMFHWNSRTESFLVGAIVILTAGCAIWLKYRLFGSFTIFDISIPLILLTPLQYETLFVTANLAHGPIPLLLVVVFCIAWTIPSVSFRLALALLLNFFAIHTGFGFFLGLITPVVLVADYWLNLRHTRKGRLSLLFSLLVSVASLALFFANYHFETSVDCSPNLFRSPSTYAQFLWLMYANTLGAKGQGPFAVAVGIVLLAAVVAVLFMSAAMLRTSTASDRPIHLVSGILLAFCLLFSVNAAYGRSCLAIHVAQVSRYVIYMECGLLGLYFFLLTLPSSVFRRMVLLIMSLALIGTIPIRWQDRAVMNFIRSAKSNWSACYIRFEDVRGCNHAVGYGVYPNLDRDLKGKLEFLKQSKQNLYAGQ